jgi:hypothetical protein
VLGSLGHYEDIARLEGDGSLAPIGIAQRDVEPAFKAEEELIGVVVDVPNVFASGVRDSGGVFKTLFTILIRR